MYKLILEDGELIGNYSYKKIPQAVAKSIMRVLYLKTGVTQKDIKFKNMIQDITYTYRCHIEILKKPIIKKFGDRIVEQKYKIYAKQI